MSSTTPTFDLFTPYSMTSGRDGRPEEGATSLINHPEEHIVETAIDDRAKQEILQILERISLLKPAEKLLLYMRMPNGTAESDPLRQPQNPLGTRSEINHTINWVRSHLEHDPNVSIPKQDVYDDYVLYCGRVNIKPLSTADFGKVMKQVFPEIRPRRLGTRGNSRYCYAALRKTTKLPAPRLPDLIMNNTTSGVGSKYNEVPVAAADLDEESSNVIRKWASMLLNVQFEKTKDLADYITTNNLNTLHGNRRQLQKKILSKEARAQKKAIDVAQASKRRRRKRRKNSCSSEQATPPSEQSPLANAATADNKTTHKPKKNLLTTSLSAIDIANIKQEIDGKRQLPQSSASSLRLDQQFVFNSEIVQTAAVSSATAAINKDSKLRSHLNIQSPCILKQEMLDADDDDDDSVNDPSPDILCKKVRQAQQTKGSQLHNMSIQNEIELMRPPNYSNNNRLMTITPTLINEINSLKRVGKYAAAAAQGHMDVSGGGEKDDVTTDIIMPRERVISICNLDKDALDDYLNGGDSSQDQEAELLKYFQHDEESSSGGAVDCTITKTPNTNSALPILENYQLNSDYQSKNIVSRTKLHSQMMDKVNQLSELRQYLQQNLQSTGNSISAVKPEMPVHGYAGAALSMMSNRYVNGRDQSFALSLPFQQQHLLHHHQQQQQQQPQQHQHQQQQQPPQPQLHQNHKDLKRHSSNPATPCNNNSSNSSSNIPHSPNSRRKNFSFVPISPGPQSPRTVQGYQQVPLQHSNVQNPFISPRATSAIRKPILKTQHSVGAPTMHQAAVTCTATSTAPPTHPRTPSNETNSAFLSNIYSKPTQGINLISASAPPSPSIPTSQQNTRYDKKLNSSFETASSGIAPSIATKKQFSSHSFVVGYPETRSRSVPLHCQMPVVSNTNIQKLDMYPSASSSVAPTPTPHEYADFSDDNYIDILAANADAVVSTSSVKIEDSLPTILEDNLGAVGGDGVLDISEIIPELQLRQNLPNLSRSVPSTPQPTFCTGNSNGSGGVGNNKIASKQFDFSKSVPTTPIAMAGTPFRYSPEQNRDFLINGNTVETGKLGSFYNSRSQQVSVEKIAEIVEDIENDLVTFGDDADPIIGSDLLGNL